MCLSCLKLSKSALQAEIVFNCCAKIEVYHHKIYLCKMFGTKRNILFGHGLSKDQHTPPSGFSHFFACRKLSSILSFTNMYPIGSDIIMSTFSGMSTYTEYIIRYVCSHRVHAMKVELHVNSTFASRLIIHVANTRVCEGTLGRNR